MKNKIIYWVMTICLILGFTNCKEGNDNWVIVTDTPPGVYVTGSAVVYKAITPSSSFDVAPLDGGEKAEIFSLYTWIKADGELFISKMDADGNMVNYGKGETVSDVTTVLSETGAAFKVSTDGLYLLVYNSLLNQISILPAGYGVIGGATDGGWDKITPFTEVSYEDGNIFLKGNFTFSKSGMKFRFDGDVNSGWGKELPYDESGNKIIIHSNFGSVKEITDEDKKLTDLSQAFIELKGGGSDINIPAAGIYTVTLKFDLRSRKAYANAVLGEKGPEYPATLYMNGTDFGGENWDWNSPNIVPMIPVNGVAGTFWCISYFNAGNGFKWAPAKEWKGDFAQLDEIVGYKIDGGGNATVETSGLYMVYIDMPKKKITMEPAKIYGIGPAFGNSNGTEHPFTITGSEASITAPVTVSSDDKDGLRMYAGTSAATLDWWKMEFILRNGKIEYRGNGGDQNPRIGIEAGQTITLDFKTGTGTIK